MYLLSQTISVFHLLQLDKEAYSLVRKAQSRFLEYRRFINEQIGWELIINEKLVKLEKTPAFAEPFMGISEFESIIDYCVFCSLLIFLEDREDEEQFLLSEMIPAIEIQLKDLIEIDWTKFTHRKSLIRVLKFAEKCNYWLHTKGPATRWKTIFLQRLIRNKPRLLSISSATLFSKSL